MRHPAVVQRLVVKAQAHRHRIGGTAQAGQIFGLYLAGGTGRRIWLPRKAGAPGA